VGFFSCSWIYAREGLVYACVRVVCFGQLIWLTRNEVIYNDGRLDQCGLWSLIYNSQQGCSLGTEVLGRALFCYTGDALLRSPDCVKSVSALKWNTDGIRYKWSTIKDHELIFSSSILTASTN